MTSERHYPGEAVFPDLAIIYRIETEIERNGRIERETRHHICVRSPLAPWPSPAPCGPIREENRLHWILDVIFRED